jgi:Ca-activated chloride channel family protein
MLVAPTTDRAVAKAAIDGLQLADRTATGESIFTALQTIAAVGDVLGGTRDETPARIVLMSDGKETVPADPDSPRGAFTAARTAKGQGVPISTVSFGTPGGTIPTDGRQQPVPVDDEMLKRIAQLSGGSAHTASSLQQLKDVFTTLQQHIGYESIKGDASAGWLRLGALALVLAAVAGMRMHTRLPD